MRASLLRRTRVDPVFQLPQAGEVIVVPAIMGEKLNICCSTWVNTPGKLIHDAIVEVVRRIHRPVRISVVALYNDNAQERLTCCTCHDYLGQHTQDQR